MYLVVKETQCQTMDVIDLKRLTRKQGDNLPKRENKKTKAYPTMSMKTKKEQSDKRAYPTMCLKTKGLIFEATISLITRVVTYTPLPHWLGVGGRKAAPTVRPVTRRARPVPASSPAVNLPIEL
jgi:hypothetical protein